jgi:hypothetical protein
MLALFAQAVETCKSHHLDPQMRAIFDRIIPAPAPPKIEHTANVDFALRLGTVLKALQDANPRNYSEGQRETLRIAREIVLREMGRALAREAA